MELIHKTLTSLRCFGLQVTLASIYLKFGRERALRYKHKVILAWLEKHYSYLIQKYKNVEQPNTVLADDAPIWILWFQGEEGMSQIVRTCYNSVKKYAGNHPIYLLTEKNIKEYIMLPDYVIEKVYKKELKLAHYSDIVRNTILSQYGGIWLDATIYLTAPLENWDKTFYTVKQPLPDDGLFVSAYKWSSFCMGGVKGNLLHSFVREILTSYTEKEHFFIDYFLMDYAIALGYKTVPAIKELIDAVPYSNKDLYYVVNNLMNDIDKDEFEKVLENTSIFKLNRLQEDPHNDKSLFHYLGVLLVS